MDTSAPTLLPFPDLPSTNLVQPSAAQPTPSTSIDEIISQSLTQPEPVSYTGSPHKEALPPPVIQPQENTPLVEVSEHEPLPVEVEGYLQKLEDAGEIKLPEPITHDGEVLLADTEAQVVKEKIVLPMSQTAHQQALKAKTSDSKRWLAEWCTRLMKMFQGSVKYAPETTQNEL